MITYRDLGNNGRLSNQLFQLSAVLAAAKRNNDIPIFPQWQYEKEFNLHGCFVDNVPMLKNYQEPHFHYSPIPNLKNINLSGYFQTELYFIDYKDQIIDMLTPIYNFERELGLCSIHVRRGDYLTKSDCHPVMPMEYYVAAIERSGCSKFLIFSDDINWTKQNFKGNMFEFSENINPVMDMALMAKKCEHNIICNSSFSWWGAYLNKNPSKIVIAPNQWFGKKLPHNTNDLLPLSWIKI